MGARRPRGAGDEPRWPVGGRGPRTRTGAGGPCALLGPARARQLVGRGRALGLTLASCCRRGHGGRGLAAGERRGQLAAVGGGSPVGGAAAPVAASGWRGLAAGEPPLASWRRCAWGLGRGHQLVAARGGRGGAVTSLAGQLAARPLGGGPTGGTRALMPPVGGCARAAVLASWRRIRGGRGLASWRGRRAAAGAGGAVGPAGDCLGRAPDAAVPPPCRGHGCR